MRNRWIRAVAVFLTVCLLLGDSSWGLVIPSYATESSNLENLIKSENEDTSLPDTSEEESEEESQTDTPEEESEEESQTDTSEEESEEESQTDTSEEEAEDLTDESEELTDESEDVAEESEEVTDESEEVIDESEDVTEESEDIIEEDVEEPVTLFGMERSTDNRVGLPDAAADYETYEDSNKVYVFSSSEDYLKLQAHCAERDFEGVVFKIGNLGTDTIEIDQDFLPGFEGFGTEEYPFKGSMSFDYDMGSAGFALEQPLFAYVGSGAEIYNFSLKCKEGTETAIAKNIVFEDGDTESVLIHDLTISGVIKNTGDIPAGTIAGTISSNAIVELSDITSTVTEITGAVAGGIAGKIGSDVVITATDVTLSGKVSGEEAAGGFYGSITGSHTWDVSENNLGSGLTVEVEAGGYAGAFAGKLCKSEDDSILTMKSDNDITVTAEVSGAGISGGLFGVCEKDTVLEIEQPLTVDGKVSGATAGGLVGTVDEVFAFKADSFVCGAKVSGEDNAGGVFGSLLADEFVPKLFSGGSDSDRTEILITGEVSSAEGYAGGYVGTIRADVIVPKIITQSSTKISAEIGAGGVLGRLTGQSRIIVEGACIGQESGNADGGSIGAEYTGGIIGVVDSASAAELQDVFVLHANMSAGTIGSVIGKSDECFVYLSESVTTGNRTSQLLFDNATEAWAEIGSYGGVFRNQDIGSDKVLIGDGSLANVGKIDTSYVSGADDSYTVKGTEGLVCLAIALQTQGNYGMEPFGYADGEQDKVSSLLRADYVLDGDADISYDTTGVITLNRNDQTDDGSGEHTFRGSLMGASEGTRIVQNSRTYSDGVTPNTKAYQCRTGLFSTLEGGNTFKNLCVEGTVQYEKGTGGIAYRTIGDSLTLENIEMRKVFQKLSTEDAIGGIVAKEESGADSFVIDAENVILASEIYAGENTEFAGFMVSASKIALAMDDIVLGGVLKSEKNSDTAVGGFLGKKWEHVTGYIGKNDGMQVEPGTVFSVCGQFGGLVNELYNRDGQYITMQNINLDGLTIEVGNTSGRNSNNCGLLVRVGRGLALNIVDYSCKGCTVKNAGRNFDEIVGTANNNGNNTSGIISLHSTTEDFPQYHYEEQATYVGGAARGSAVSNARYFYDVYQALEAVKATGAKMDTILDSPEEVLLWSVYYNINLADGGYRVQNVFKNWLTISNTYTFDGTIDLSGVSIYPVPNANGVTLKGINDAKLIFDASNMDNHADATDDAPDKLHTTDGIWSMPNNWINGVRSQHYGLHSGLLLDASAVTASDFTLSGTVANRGMGSGALVAGTLAGGGSFRNIILDDLWIANYKGEEDYGLLISYIAADDSGTKQSNTVDVTFGNTAADGTITKGVVMTGYPSGTSRQAAAALIGRAGSTDMTNLRLDFRNMQVSDGKTVSNAHNGTVFSKASYICTYHHTSNADAYTGRCWYLFTEEEADETGSGVITYGSEIDEDTEYWWEDIANPDPHKLVIETIQNTDSDFNPSDYLPYVYQEELIEVNPKPGDINYGCGTYEDPYIIESRKQFLTLYRYLNMMKENSTDAADTEFFKDWRVNAFGSDAEICDKVHEEADLKTFGETDFPTQAQMRGAYYRLEADIDMSGMTGGNYKTIADNFVGFGTKEYPFTGIWYGKGADGTIHTVTLPSKSTFRTYDSFGFIQYAKGVVVKDMIIKAAEKDTATGEDKKNIITRVTGKGMAGSVIGCVLGGDNIIDNVVADTEFMALNYSATVNGTLTEYDYSLAAVGGYVGCVKKGGLILRNAELTDVDNYIVYNVNLQTLTGKSDNTRYIGAFVGRVEDGYVLHEDGGADKESDGSEPIWQKGRTGGAGNYVIASDYDVPDGEYLEAETVGSGGISVSAPTGSDSVKTIKAQLPNAAAVQVLSMAVSSDALNTRSETASEQGDTPKTYGYTGYSRSRKAQYDDIGCGLGASASADYQSVVAYDNVNSCPYIYKYLNIEPSAAADYMKNGRALLNAAEKIGGAAYHTTWELNGTDVYDMSVFGKGFRGIGALYDLEGGYGGTFRGNLDGDSDRDGVCAVLKLDMRSIAWEVCNGDAELCPDSMRCVGLFNTLQGVNDTSWYEENGITIENLTIIGEISVANDVKKTEESSSLPVDMGGVAARVAGMRSTFSNVTVEDFTILAGVNNTNYKSSQTSRRMGCFGGVIGNITGTQKVVFKDCVAKNTEKSTGSGAAPQMKGLGFGGGLVGAVGNSNNSIYTAAEVVITGSASVAEKLYVESVSENAGGLVGYAPYGTKLTITGGSGTDDRLEVKDCTVVSYWNAGGVVGEPGIPVSIEKIKVQGTNVKAYKNAGGVIGDASGSFTSTLNDIQVYDSVIRERSTTLAGPYNDQSGQGGVVGKNSHKMTITNAEVGVTSDTSTCIIESVANKRVRQDGAECPNGVGGIVGYHSKTNDLTLGDCRVSKIIVRADKAAEYINDTFESHVCAGGIVGYGIGAILLKGSYIHTENLTVSTVVPDVFNKGNYVAAGGCFGMNYTLRSVESSNYYSGISAVNNVVRGKVAGGVTGIAMASVWLSEPEVSGGTVYGVESAGGIAGSCKQWSGVNFSLNKAAATEAEAASNPVAIVDDVTITGKYVGGAIGSVMMSGPMRLENLKISNCKLIGETMTSASGVSSGNGIGGVIGFYRIYQNNHSAKLYYIELENNTIVYESENDKLNSRESDSVSEGSSSYVAVGGIMGRIYKPSTNYTGYIYADNIILHPNNLIGIRKAGSDVDDISQVKLITGDNKLTDVTLPQVSDGKTTADAAAELAEDYGYYVGTLIGVNHANTIYPYMMRIRGSADTDTPPVLAQPNAPTTDVGRIPGMEPQEYRKKTHIIYGIRTSGTEDGKPNVEYMDSMVENAFAEYTGTETLQSLCQVYHLQQELTAQTEAGDGAGAGEAVTRPVEEMWEEAYSLTGTVGGSEQTLPILVCKPGVITLDQQIKLFADIMTNVSGISSAKVGILSITQQKVAWDLATDTRTKTAVDETTSHISITKTADNDYNFVYNGTENFDSYEGDVLNYTELIFEYKCENSHVRSFILPVFVEEPLILDVQAKMLAGRVSSVTAMADGVTDTATIANDSDYTLLLDFSYGNARKSYDRTMEKQIYLTNEQGIKQFEEGTRLLLIDVTNGNKPYYYTITSTSPDKIPLSAFTDTGEAAGTVGTTAYTEQKINRMINADGVTAYDGHDRYILQVLPGVKGENTIYDIHIGFKDIDDTNKSTYSMEGITETVITADAIPGLQFQLLETGAGNNLVEPQQGTLVSGELSEGGILTVDMEYCIKMDPEYRSKTNPMDSANNDKYLDLACYLSDENGKRIPLPDGTNIQYEDEDGNVVTKLLTDYVSVYYYKDAAEAEYQIRGDNGITDTVQVPLQIKILLPDDISALTEDTYTVHIDLLRTDDPAYPSGYEDALDTYQRSIGAEVIPKLGFAVTVEESDWDKLGINTYCYDEEFPRVEENGTQIHEIPFKVQLDFRNILKQVAGDEIEEEWADKDYHITYRFFGKNTDGSYPSMVFTDDGAAISPETLRVAAKEDTTDGSTVYAVGSGGSLKMKYQFTKDEIHDNRDSLLQKGIPIEREGKVILNMEQLKGIRSKAELEKYLTNYKMEAVLQITDRDVSPSEIGADDVSDFFIFNVTRLKTDIE